MAPMPPEPGRRAFLAGAAALLGGCLGLGGRGAEDTATSTDNPALGDVEQRGPLQLRSPAFGDGQPIPEPYSHGGDNVNPPLHIEGVPDGTETFALVMDDPDAPGGAFVHWLVWNIDAARRDIPEGWTPDEATVGENDFGNHRYDGPDPPDSTHTYRFKLYALASRLALSQSASRQDLGAAMWGRITAATQLTGTYSPGGR